MANIAVALISGLSAIGVSLFKRDHKSRSKKEAEKQTKTNAEEVAQRKKENEILKRAIADKDVAIARVQTEKHNLEALCLKAQQERTEAYRQLSALKISNEKEKEVWKKALADKDVVLARVQKERLEFEELCLKAQKREQEAIIQLKDQETRRKREQKILTQAIVVKDLALAQAVTENARLQTLISKIEQEKVQALADLDTANKKSKEFEELYKTTKKEKKDLEKENLKLKEEMKSRDDKIEKLSKDNDELTNKVDKMQTQLDQQDTKMEEMLALMRMMMIR
jgi:chromosome segregation ATPase